jgi:hypothetical protein
MITPRQRGERDQPANTIRDEPLNFVFRRKAIRATQAHDREIGTSYMALILLNF